MNELVKRGHSNTVLMRDNILTSDELVRAILYEWVCQFVLDKNREQLQTHR